MGLISDFKKWWRREEYCRRLEGGLSAQTSMTFALFQQMQMFKSDLELYMRGFRKQKHDAKLCKEILNTLENIIQRFEQ
jgi:hypothetical protein